MTDEKKIDRSRFNVITNDSYKEERPEQRARDRYERAKMMSYQSNPLKVQGQSLREQFMRFTNDEGEPRFTVEDLLKW